MITTIPDRERDLQAQVDALTEELERLRAQEPVALKSVHLIRDVQGMCAVLVNGRMAIRDNGDIIDHFATLDWFAAPPAQPAEPVQLTETEIFKAYTTATGKVLPNKWGVREELVAITRIVERAHGIEAAPKATK